MSRSILLVLLLIFLGLIIQPAAGEVSGWEVIPENPAIGDGLKIRGNAEPGEEVGILVSFEKTVPVYLREYSYELDGIEILDFNNQVTVRAEGVEDLNVGWILPVSLPFCDTCNRLRLTAGGKLRPCLLSDRQVDIKTHLRSQVSDEKLAELIIAAVRLKQARHGLGEDVPTCISGQMSSIGG